MGGQGIGVRGVPGSIPGGTTTFAVKLAQLVRCSLMVQEVASSIPSGAVFAHVNIELA